MSPLQLGDEQRLQCGNVGAAIGFSPFHTLRLHSRVERASEARRRQSAAYVRRFRRRAAARCSRIATRCSRRRPVESHLLRNFSAPARIAGLSGIQFLALGRMGGVFIHRIPAGNDGARSTSAAAHRLRVHGTAAGGRCPTPFTAVPPTRSACGSIRGLETQRRADFVLGAGASARQARLSRCGRVRGGRPGSWVGFSTFLQAPEPFP